MASPASRPICGGWGAEWTAGIFARRPDDGAAIWAYQWEPHDEYDYDGINETILLDLEIDGQTRRVLVRPERNGHIYVMDRTSGEVLSAEPYVHVTVTKGVDLKTGRPIKVEEKKTGSAGWSATSARPLPAGKIGNPRLIP